MVNPFIRPLQQCWIGRIQKPPFLEKLDDYWISDVESFERSLDGEILVHCDAEAVADCDDALTSDAEIT